MLGRNPAQTQMIYNMQQQRTPNANTNINANATPKSNLGACNLIKFN